MAPVLGDSAVARVDGGDLASNSGPDCAVGVPAVAVEDRSWLGELAGKPSVINCIL